MKAINPRKTEEYQRQKSKYDDMSSGDLALAVVYELYRMMMYKKALSTPDYPGPTLQEYALDDAVRERL